MKIIEKLKIFNFIGVTRDELKISPQFSTKKISKIIITSG